MLKEETIEFLRNVPPLNFLPKEALEDIAGDVSLEYYPRGHRILSEDGPPGEHLRIIRKGGVKVYMTSSEGREMVVDFRSEGEQFGLLSVISGDRSRANVVAVEDTICYLIPREKVLSIIRENPAVNEYFLKSFFINFIDRTYDETRKRCFAGAGIVDSERALFTTRVGDIVTREPVTAGEDVTIQEAARTMAGHRISSLVILDGAGVPAGIITDRDLREKVVARGRDLTGPARMIMSSPLVKVDAEEYCFEALLRMMRHNIHHILVVESGTFRGVVTNHDFMVLQGSSPTVLVKELEKTQGLENLGRTRNRLFKTVSSLLMEGARAGNITGLITELAEKLINRVVDAAEKKTGAPPLSYTLFLLGGGGRRELTLDLDIRLGVIYEDTNNLTVIKAAEEYFTRFIENFREAMSSCSIPCGGNCLPFERIRSLSDWKDMFQRWTGERHRHAPIAEYFDMRAIRGEEAPVESLREELYGLAGADEELMDLMAAETVANRPPLGFFKRFVVEKTGEHRNELDIRRKGIRPMVDSVRIFSIEKGIRDIPTARRLSELGRRYSFEQAEEVGHALEYLTSLLIHNQLEQIEKGLEPDSFLAPERLSNLEKRSLKEAFQLIVNLYDILEKSYRTQRVG